MMPRLSRVPQCGTKEFFRPLPGLMGFGDTHNPSAKALGYFRTAHRHSTPRPSFSFLIETHSLPTLAHCYPRSFTFYVAQPIRSILTSSFFLLTLVRYASCLSRGYSGSELTAEIQGKRSSV